MNENKLETEKISKLFFTVVLSSIVAMVILGIQSMVDGLFLGNFVGTYAMASVNVAQPYFQSTSAIAFIIGVGGTAFIGRLIGAKEEDQAKGVFKTAFLTITVASIIFGLIGCLFSSQIANLLGADQVLIQNSALYIKILSISLPFNFLYVVLSFVNRVLGKPQLFLIATITGILSNILFNYILIVRLDLGVFGAALATSISYVLGFLINIPPVLSKKTAVNIYSGKFSMDFLLKMTYNGASEGVTSISVAVTTLIFNLTFMHYYGANGVSAYTIISYISLVATLLLFGIADGTNPIISVNYGAKRFDRVKEILNIAGLTSIALGFVLFLVVIFKGESLIQPFANGDLELISMTYNGAKLYAYMFLICGVNILASSYFTSIGKAFQSMIISASRGLIFIFFGVILLPTIFGVTGVWLVAPFADLITIFILIFMYIKSQKL